MHNRTETRRYKAPRWISTEAGQWAYEVNEEWREIANHTFGVIERQRLLADAERMRQESQPASS